MFERHKIFISYRRSGGYEIANKIENFFGEERKSDFEVFQDVKDMGKENNLTKTFTRGCSSNIVRLTVEHTK